jgi:hypothetical protein
MFEKLRWDVAHDSIRARSFVQLPDMSLLEKRVERVPLPLLVTGI